MKPKVLFVIDSLNSGGAEKSLSSLLSMFDLKRYEVDLLMFYPKGLYISLLPAKVNILDVPPSIQEQQEKVSYFLHHKKYKRLYLKLRTIISLRNPFTRKKLHNAQITWKWLSKEVEQLNKKYDFAVAYSQGHPTYFVAEKVNAKKKICWMNTDYKMAGYSNLYDEKYYKQYDNIVAVSDYNKKVFLQEMPIARKKTIVMYDLISQRIIESMILQEEGYKDGYKGLRILTIGRLVDIKGYHFAIEACYKLKQAGYQFKWYVIGEGPLQKQLVNKVQSYQLEDTFIFLGTHTNPYNFLKESDIYVQASKYEGFGLAIAEARLLNIPVVTTNFDSAYDQIDHRKNGLIVNMNADALYKGILELMQQDQLRISIKNHLKEEKKGNVEEIKKLYKLLS